MTETEKILEMLAQMRVALIPEQYKRKPKRWPPEETRMARLATAGTESLFELAVILDAVGAFRNELNDTIVAFEATLLPDWLNVYSMWKRWCRTRSTRSSSRASSACARRTTTRTGSRFRRGRRRRRSRFPLTGRRSRT